MSPDHTIAYNTVIELTIHLEAVLLTGIHLLVMPLKHLGLSPENMQVNMHHIGLSRPLQLSLFQLVSVSK